MYNNQSATDNSNQSFFGPRGTRGCGGPGFGGKFGAKFGGRAPWMKHFAGMMGNRPAVNIEETDSAYTLYVYAAGLVKEAFTVSVKNDVLTIAYKAPETADSSADQFSHREHNAGSFERLFQLSEKVLTDRINATYTDGVLKVVLPKNPETTKPAQKVSVS